MKNLNKKIGAVALAGMMVMGSSGLSQGLISHAISISPNNKSYLSYEEIENRRLVVRYEEKYNYSSKCLDKKPSSVHRFYKDRWQFERDIDGDLKKFKGQKDSINIQIGAKSWFRISIKRFRDYHSQFIYDIVRDASEKYNFRISLYADARSNPSLAVFLASIRSKFANNEELKNNIIRRDVLYYNEYMLRDEPHSLKQLLRHRDSKGYAKVAVGHLLFLLEDNK